MKKILITGFEPFGGSEVNPSAEILKALGKKRFEGVEVFTLLLPVEKTSAPRLIMSEIERIMPDIVLSLGEAAGRSVVSIERVAINLMDYRIADNQGNRVEDEPVVVDGPAAYFVSLPVRKLYDVLRRRGIPVELSLTAGAFLCNQVLYHVLHWISIRKLPISAGFVHFPSLPEQVSKKGIAAPSMALETSIQATSLLVRTLRDR